MFRWRRINGKQAQYRQQDVNSSSWKASGSIKTWFMPDIWCCVLSSIMNRTERKTASQVTPSQCGSGTGLGQGSSSPGRAAGGRAGGLAAAKWHHDVWGRNRKRVKRFIKYGGANENYVRRNQLSRYSWSTSQIAIWAWSKPLPC